MKKYPAGHLRTWGPFVWCRYGIVISPWLCIWWGKWGHFLSTMQLVPRAAVRELEDWYQ